MVYNHICLKIAYNNTFVQYTDGPFNLILHLISLQFHDHCILIDILQVSRSELSSYTFRHLHDFLYQLIYASLTLHRPSVIMLLCLIPQLPISLL